MHRLHVMVLAVALAACAGHGAGADRRSDATDAVDPRHAQALACRTHMQFTSTAARIMQRFAEPQPLAGMAGHLATFRELLTLTDAAFDHTAPFATKTYRKAILRAREAIQEREASIAEVPEDVALAARRVATTREAARTFAKGRGGAVDVIMKAAEADLGFRELDGARTEEIAQRLSEAAKVHPGATPLATYASALRDLARAGAKWDALVEAPRFTNALADLSRAAGAFGATCKVDGASQLGGTKSATADALRQSALIVSNLPTKACVDSAKALFPEMPDNAMHAHGTGIIVRRDDERLLVTNRHVVAGAGAISAARADGSALPPVHLTYLSPEHDIAVLAFDTQELPPALEGMALAEKDPPELTPVIAAGFPGLFGRASFQVTRGEVSNARLSLPLPDSGREAIFLQHTAIVDPGSSGGPLVNQRGELVGINAQKATDREAVTFAIPVSVVRSILGVAQGARETASAHRSARTTCQLAVDALQRGPDAADAIEAMGDLSAPDLRTHMPIAKDAVALGMHRPGSAPCEVLRSVALTAEFAELRAAGRPSTLERCAELREGSGGAAITIPLTKGTATFEFRVSPRDGGIRGPGDENAYVQSFRVDARKR